MSDNTGSLSIAFKALADSMREQGFSTEQLQALISPQTEHSIPATAFAQGLTALETAATYFDEDIHKIVGRPKHTIDHARNAGRKKQPLTWNTEGPHIPITLFSDRTLSPMEHICAHLKAQGMRNKDLAALLNKDPRTIWTVLARIKTKRGEVE